MLGAEAGENRKLRGGEARRTWSTRAKALVGRGSVESVGSVGGVGREGRVRWWLSVAWVVLVIGFGCVSSTHGTDNSATSPLAVAGGGSGAGEGGVVLPPHPASLSYFVTGPMAEARAAFEGERWGEAAKLFEAALKSPDPSRTLEMQHGARLLMGVAQSRAKLWADAAVTLQSLADDGGELSDYALFLAAEAAVADENPEGALKAARGVGKGSLMRGPALLMLAKAHMARTEPAEAETALTEAKGITTDATPEGREVRLLLGQALEAQEKWEGAGQAYFDLAKKIPGRSEGKAAKKALDAIFPKLTAEQRERFTLGKGGGATPTPPTPSDPLAAAKDLYEKHRSEDAIAAFEKLRKKHAFKKEPGVWCEATYLIAKSHTKLREHAKAVPFYEEVIDKCEGQGKHHLNALYNGGKAHWNAGTSTRAAEIFGLIADKYPQDSLADDALLLAARIQAEQGKKKQAQETLQKQIDTYPSGDMLKEAHWMLMGEAYSARRYEDVIAYVDANSARSGEDDLYTRGRMAYFKARSQEHLGRKGDAVDGFEALIKSVPMGFYSLMALGRLNALDAERAAALVASLRADGAFDAVGGRLPLFETPPPPPGTPPSIVPPAPDPDFMRDPSYKRAVLLARLGLHAWSDAEWDRVKVPEALADRWLWTRITLLDGVGRYTTSHKKAESKLPDPPTAYPSDADAQRRWALLYPRPFITDVWTQAHTQALPPHLVYAIMREESSFNPQIESFANARGLMQLMLPTAESQAEKLGDAAPSAADLFVPATSIRLGAGYLAKLGGLFGSHLALIVAGYNGGQGNVGRWLDERGDQALDLWIEEIPYGQTRDYTKRVLTTLWRYQWLYNESAQSLALFDPAISAKAAAGR